MNIKHQILALLAVGILFSFSNAYAQQRMPVPYYQQHSGCSNSNSNSNSNNSNGITRMTGKEFIKSLDTVGFYNARGEYLSINSAGIRRRDSLTVRQILAGNVPDSLKYFKNIVFTTDIVDSIPILRRKHRVEIQALPDYLSVGTNEDFIRMPMTPKAAIEIADSLYCSLPTAYLTDKIADAAEGSIDPFPFRPVKDRNCQPYVFEDSNNAINELFKVKGYHFGQLISGLKKDVILSYKTNYYRKLTDEDSAALAARGYNPDGISRYETIYGWRLENGKNIQQSYSKHVNWYVDYSHGVRLIYRTIKIDGKTYDIYDVLQNPKLYRIISDEPECMQKTESSTEISNEQYTPSTLIISYGERKDTTALYKAVKKYGASFIYKYNNFNAIAISIPKEKNIGDAIIYFKKIKGVLSVDRDRIYHLDGAPSAQ
jgi:hypothetical protein